MVAAPSLRRHMGLHITSKHYSIVRWTKTLLHAKRSTNKNENYAIACLYKGSIHACTGKTAYYIPSHKTVHKGHEVLMCKIARVLYL